MADRTIAIVHSNSSMDSNVYDTIHMIFSSNCASQIYVFTAQPNTEFNVPTEENQTCLNVVWPSSCNTAPKIRNWINQYFKTNGFNGFLHVVEDTTKICIDPSAFMAELEHMMDILDYNVWFSTYTDPCNFVYRKYNPRLEIDLDDPKYKKLELSKILYTSHSNTAWVAYDFSKVQDQLLKFDEDFTIPMFWIIEFLARRKETRRKGQLFYMNQYLAIPLEHKLLETLSIESKILPQQMQEEDAKFKEKNIKYAPDNNIDIVLEDTYCLLKSKLS